MERYQRRAAHLFFIDYSTNSLKVVTKIVFKSQLEVLRKIHRHSQLSMMRRIRNNLVDLKWAVSFMQVMSQPKAEPRLFQEGRTDQILKTSTFQGKHQDGRIYRPAFSPALNAFKSLLVGQSDQRFERTDITFYYLFISYVETVSLY